jgi:putative ABC transport system substrate-binding protein
MRRREFITLVGGSAAALPFAVRAEQPVLPVVGFFRDGSDAPPRRVAAFRKGLNETGYVEGQNVTVEYHWIEGQYDHLSDTVADLVRRRVAVIVASGSVAVRAAKAATATIPIVFDVGGDPVRLGLVTSFGRPGGNATGINVLTSEVIAKRLRLLHDLVPKATRVAALVNPGNASVTETTLQEVQEAAPILGLQFQIIKATTIAEIDAAFATIAREPTDALLVAPDALFTGRRVQLAILAARDRIPTIYGSRDFVEVGGLISYGPDLAEMWHQLGVYTGSILKGANPAALPVLQSTKFELVINLTTSKALGLTVPPDVLSIADEVIE